MNHPGQLPRLSIGHLLLLTFCVALALAFVAPEIHSFLRMPADQLHGSKALAVLTVLLDYSAIGVIAFGVIILFQWASRNPQEAWQPGHWYFAIAAAQSLIVLLYGHWLVRLGSDWRFWTAAWYAGLYLLPLIIASVAAIKTRPWRWRFAYVLLIMALLTLAGFLARRAAEIGFGPINGFDRHWIPASVISTCLFGLAFTLATAWDFFGRAQRDWLHYFALMPVTFQTLSLAVAWGPHTLTWMEKLLHYLTS